MWRRLRDRLENNSNILLFRTNPSQELSIPRHYPTSRADGSRQLCVHQSLKFLFIRQLAPPEKLNALPRASVFNLPRS